MTANEAAGGKAPLCVVLAAFPGHKGAGRARRELDSAFRSVGAKVLDEVVLTVNAKRRTRVHDPHRVVAGTLTSTLTWGLFGLATSDGSASGLVIWGVLGAICGGAFAYATEHVLTKSELRRVGGQLAADSSVLVTYLRDADERLVLERATTVAARASTATVGTDLSVRVSDSGANGAEDRDADLSMMLLRYAGEHAARKTWASAAPSKDVQVELIFETPKQGRPRVVSPTAGVAAMAKSDVASWGGFGVAFGLIAGWLGGGAVLGLEEGIVTGIAWAVFGLAAGALYGLWVGRSISARRAAALQSLLPPETSTALVWFVGAQPRAMDDRTRVATQHLALRFHPSQHGPILQAS
jgi:outer membrane lipoprotein SlyB